MALFGDRPFGWRIFPALFGTLGAVRAMRALWFASLSRFATLAGGVLIATAIPLYIQSRIAMLDMFMVSFTMVALWMCAAALRKPEKGALATGDRGRRARVRDGLEVERDPDRVLPGLAFLVLRAWTRAAQLLFATATAHRSRGWALQEAALWLGLVPLIGLRATFIPAYLLCRCARSATKG